MNNPIVVLYVEDEPRSRKVMEMITAGMDVSLTVFEHSANFLSRALDLQPRPDVIFLDIHMKPYSGFEMIEMLRESRQFEGIPVIAMTASVMNEEVQQLKTAGFDGCLAKPLDFDAFPEMFERIANGEKIWRIIT
jgi:CheY-like chemotaxis protein